MSYLDCKEHPRQHQKNLISTPHLPSRSIFARTVSSPLSAIPTIVDPPHCRLGSRPRLLPAAAVRHRHSPSSSDNKVDGDGATGNDDGAGATGDDNDDDEDGDDDNDGDGAMGDGVTGYDNDDDDDGATAEDGDDRRRRIRRR